MGKKEDIKKHQQKSFTDVELFDDLFQQFQKKVDEITWDGSKDWDRTWDGRIYNEILIENAQKIEKEIDAYLIKRTKHGLDLTDEMKNFKGYEEIKKDLQPKSPPVTTPKSEKEWQELRWHEPIDEVDSEGYANCTLYFLAQDMEEEWEDRKSSEEFRCYDGDRIKFFEWCSHKFTYKGGKTFTAKGLENSLIVSRSRAKSKKEKDYK